MRRLKASIVVALLAGVGVFLAGCGDPVQVHVHVDCPRTCVDVHTGDLTGVPAAAASVPARPK